MIPLLLCIINISNCVNDHRLDLQLGSVHLQDQFVWDVSNPDACPEQFAGLLCKELGLDTAWCKELAWHIRDQVYKYKRTHKKIGRQM